MHLLPNTQFCTSLPHSEHGWSTQQPPAPNYLLKHLRGIPHLQEHEGAVRWRRAGCRLRVVSGLHLAVWATLCSCDVDEHSRLLAEAIIRPESFRRIHQKPDDRKRGCWMPGDPTNTRRCSRVLCYYLRKS